MHHTKDQLKESILKMAVEFGIEQGFSHIIATYPGMPKIVEMISYEMFLNEFNSQNCSDELLESYKIIHEFATELRKKGFVDYK